MRRRTGAPHRGQKGFTLIEMLVAMAITGVIGAGVTMAAVQVGNISSLSNNRIVVVKQVESAAYWLGRDARVAQTVQPGGGSGFPLNLTWVEWDNTTHAVDYTLTNGELMRSHSVNGTAPVQTLIALHIDDSADKTTCQFANGVFNIKITASVSGFRGASETRMAQAIPRSAL